MAINNWIKKWSFNPHTVNPSVSLPSSPRRVLCPMCEVIWNFGGVTSLCPFLEFYLPQSRLLKHSVGTAWLTNKTKLFLVILSVGSPSSRCVVRALFLGSLLTTSPNRCWWILNPQELITSQGLCFLRTVSLWFLILTYEFWGNTNTLPSVPVCSRGSHISLNVWITL